MSWSAGRTIMVASGLRAATRPIPRATAGPVSRLAGSANMFSAGSEEAISRTASACTALVRMKVFSTGTRPLRR